jgi:hypothetical protein
MFLRSALPSFGTSGLAVTPASTALAADAGAAGRKASDVACAELPLDAREVPGDAADSKELPLAHCPCTLQKQRAVIQDSGCMCLVEAMQVRLSSCGADKAGSLTFGTAIAGLLAIDTAGNASVDATAGRLGAWLGAAGGRFARAAAVAAPPHALGAGACCHAM